MGDYTMKRPEGSRKTKRIVGRGASARRGATAGRGTKGQNARSGGGVKPGFEGGQMPLYRRIARRGFNNERFTKRYEVINVGDLGRWFADGDVVNRESLLAKKVVKRKSNQIKILGKGEIEVKLTVEVDAVSEGARTKLEKAGGSVSIVEKVSSDGD